jgi:hypothetical protein
VVERAAKIANSCSLQVFPSDRLLDEFWALRLLAMTRECHSLV